MIFLSFCNQNFVNMLVFFYSVVNASACPITYQAILTVTGFTGAHSGTYMVTIENRADNIEQSFERILEG